MPQELLPPMRVPILITIYFLSLATGSVPPASTAEITAEQRDFFENPVTPSKDDDCYGQHTLADRFPGGREKAFSKFTHHDPVGFDDPDEGWDVAEEYSDEFIEWFENQHPQICSIL